MGGRFHHATRAATGAKSTPLAAERDQVFVSTAIALDAQEPVFEQTALQIVLKLPAHESGKMTTGALDLLHKAGVVFGEDGVKRCLLRPVAVVGGSGKNRGWSRQWT